MLLAMGVFFAIAALGCLALWVPPAGPPGVTTRAEVGRDLAALRDLLVRAGAETDALGRAVARGSLPDAAVSAARELARDVGRAAAALERDAANLQSGAESGPLMRDVMHGVAAAEEARRRLLAAVEGPDHGEAARAARGSLDSDDGLRGEPVAVAPALRGAGGCG